jgi:hypothetical protein
MNKKFTFVLLTALMITAFSCTPKNNEQQTAAASPFKPSATLQEIMLAVIDPNVDPIWNSIKTTVSDKGVEEIKPTTEEDWAKLKLHALALREASNLLVIDGREVAHPTASTSIHPVELGPKEIEALIAANRPAFIKNAHALHDAATLAISAIDAKDVNALEAVGGTIEHACEQCHSQFWYPGDKRPTH